MRSVIGDRRGGHDDHDLRRRPASRRHRPLPGHPHEVTHIDRLSGWAWPVAFDDAGWAMALGHDLVLVQRAV